MSIASRTTGSQLFSIAIVAMCLAWTRPRRAPIWNRFGNPRGCGRRLFIAEIDHAAAAARGDLGREHLDRVVPGLHRLGELAEALQGDLAEQHRVKGVVAVAGAGPLFLPPLDRLLHAVAGLSTRAK